MVNPDTPPDPISSAKPRPGSNKPFWPVSLVIHAVLLGLLVFVPAKEYFKQDKADRKRMKPEIKKRGQELDEVMEKIRDITAQRLEGKVALLDAGQDRMAENFETLNTHFQPHAEQQKQAAMARMSHYADETLERMNRLRKALEDAAKADAVEKLGDLRRVSDDIGNRVLVGQEEIRRGLMFLAPENTALVEQQTAAEEGQIQVSQHLGWSLGAASKVISDREKIKEVEAKIPPMERDLTKLVKNLENLDKRLVEQTKKFQQAQERARESKLDEQEKRRRNDTRKKEEDALNKLKRERGDLAKEIQQLERKLNPARQDLVKLKDSLEQNSKSWQSNLNVARNVQNGTFYKQRDVVNALYKDAGKDPILMDE